MANALTVVRGTLKRSARSLRQVGSGVIKKTTETYEALKHERKIGPALHEQVLGAMAVMKLRDSSLEDVLRNAHAYAVLPNVSKANLVLGAAYGIGEVFEQGRVVGYAGLAEFTLGVQVGGETFDLIVVFDDKDVFERFKEGKYALAANAAIAVLKARAEAAHGFGEGTKTYVHSDGGLQIVASLGLHKFVFKPAGLGRLRTDEKHTGAAKLVERTPRTNVFSRITRSLRH